MPTVEEGRSVPSPTVMPEDMALLFEQELECTPLAGESPEQLAQRGCCSSHRGVCGCSA